MTVYRPRTFALLGALLLPACAPSNSTPVAGTCPPVTVPTDDWRLADLGPFSMQVPPGFERADVQPIDSRAGVFRRASDGAEISYDYGWYSNALAPDATNLTESLRCRESIGGLPATIVTGRLSDSTAAAGRHVAAAAWRNVERDDQPVHLTIWTSTPDSAEIEMLRGVLQSVRFDVDE